MDISKFIYDYLMEYSIPVVVPDLGCFTIVNIPSEIRDGTIIPPFKTVKLDTENTCDDGVLASYIARKENITIEQAAVWLRNFYHHNFLKKLPIVKVIVFEKFGTFSLNEYNNIVFCPDADFFKDNYGLGNAYFSGNLHQQPQAGTVAPEPEPIFTPEPEPTFIPEPEPIFTPEPESMFTPEPEPIFTPEPEEIHTFSDQPQPSPEDSLFDMNDSSRFRENPKRNKRTPMFEKKEPPVRPFRAKTPPVSKKPQQQKTGSSNLWVLWVLLAAAVLSIGGYYFYPKIYPLLFSPNTTVTTLLDFRDEPEPVTSEKPEEEIPNAGLAQTLDDATDKKNALNPEVSQQTGASTAQSQPQSQSTPAVAPPTTVQRPVNVTQSPANVGQGRFVLIVASFRSRSEAERFGGRLQQSEGINYEIIAATVNGEQWNRVSVGSYDTEAEATRQANQMKSMPLFKDVWVAKR